MPSFLSCDCFYNGSGAEMARACIALHPVVLGSGFPVVSDVWPVVHEVYFQVPSATELKSSKLDLSDGGKGSLGSISSKSVTSLLA